MTFGKAKFIANKHDCLFLRRFSTKKRKDIKQKQKQKQKKRRIIQKYDLN